MCVLLFMRGGRESQQRNHSLRWCERNFFAPVQVPIIANPEPQPPQYRFRFDPDTIDHLQVKGE